MRKKVTTDPEFSWFEKNFASQRMALNPTTGDIDNTTDPHDLIFSSGALQVKAGTMLLVEESGEILRATVDATSDTSLTACARAQGSVAKTAVDPNGNNVNPYITIIGSAYQEGSSAPTGINYDVTKVLNYTQIFRNTLQMTRTAAKTRLRTGDAVREAKRECLELHSTEIERAFWFGNKKEIVADPRRMTDGVLARISTNVVDNTGDGKVSAINLETWLEQAFRFGASEKMGFCGNLALLAINTAARKNASFQMLQGQKEYGMAVNRLVSPFGELVLKTHPLFNLITGGTTGTGPYYGRNSWLAILDMGELVYRPLTDSDTKYEPKLETNDLDGLQSGYITEAGMEVHHERHHMLVKGLVTGIVDP
jgi:hypothetical protein